MAYPRMNVSASSYPKIRAICVLHSRILPSLVRVRASPAWAFSYRDRYRRSISFRDSMVRSSSWTRFSSVSYVCISDMLCYFSLVHVVFPLALSRMFRIICIFCCLILLPIQFKSAFRPSILRFQDTAYCGPGRQS